MGYDSDDADYLAIDIGIALDDVATATTANSAVAAVLGWSPC